MSEADLLNSESYNSARDILLGRIVQLEAENHTLKTDEEDLHFLNKWSGERIAQLEATLELTKAQTLAFQHERNELSKAVALANGRTAELEEEKLNLCSTIGGYFRREQAMRERIAALEAERERYVTRIAQLVDFVWATAEAEGHLSPEARALLP
jgi:chromosome segregation ATPase